VLLGLGDDGHTASLFPGTAALRENNSPVVAVYVPRLKTWRITMTLPVLNAARAVIFLVTGSSKRAMVRKVLDAPGPDETIPATLIRPRDGKLLWMLDDDAAGRRTYSRPGNDL
jgi:6-phosphogluconolactonase